METNMSDEEKKDEKKEEQKNEEKAEEKKEEKVEEAKEEKAEETKEGTKEEVKEERDETGEKAEKKPAESAKMESAESAKAKPSKAAPTGKFKDLIKSIEELSVLELADLVKELEERFGVSAAAPMMAMGAMPAAGGAAAPVEEEKANYTVHLADAGAQKIAVIKAIREIRQDLGLKEAKDLVDGAPKDIKADVPKADAEEAKKKLEAAGAKVELK